MFGSFRAGPMYSPKIARGFEISDLEITGIVLSL